MSTEWNRLQADYDFNNGKSDYHTSCLWTTNIVCNIWHDWYELWELRNGVIHGHDSTSRHKAKRDLAEKEIRMIYDSRDTMLPADRDHLEDDVEDHLTGKTTKRLQNWLNTYRGLFKKSISEAKKRSVTGVQSIRSYFPRRELPTVHNNTATIGHNIAETQQQAIPGVRSIRSYFPRKNI